MTIQVKDDWIVVYCDNPKCRLYEEMFMLGRGEESFPCDECGQ